MKAEQEELRAYLLGQLPEAVAAEMDARLFADDDFHREIEKEQELLIEDFLANRLSEADHSIFQTQCAASPELQDRVTSLRLLLAAMNKTAMPVAPAQQLWVVTSNRRRLLLLASQALAASLLVVGFLYVRDVRKSTHTIAQLQMAPNPTVRPANSSTAGPVFTVFLSADVPRGTETATKIAIPANASALEFQVEVHNRSKESTRWEVELVRDKETVWKSLDVPLQRAGPMQYLSLRIQHDKLAPGTYVVRYAPSTNDGAVQSRTFQITRETLSTAKPE